jgi:hypothetical protein
MPFRVMRNGFLFLRRNKSVLKLPRATELALCFLSIFPRELLGKILLSVLWIIDELEKVLYARTTSELVLAIEGFLLARFSTNLPLLPYLFFKNSLNVTASPFKAVSRMIGWPQPSKSKRAAGKRIAARCKSKRARLNAQLTTVTVRG